MGFQVSPYILHCGCVLHTNRTIIQVPAEDDPPEYQLRDRRLDLMARRLQFLEEHYTLLLDQNRTLLNQHTTLSTAMASHSGKAENHANLLAFPLVAMILACVVLLYALWSLSQCESWFDLFCFPFIYWQCSRILSLHETWNESMIPLSWPMSFVSNAVGRAKEHMCLSIHGHVNTHRRGTKYHRILTNKVWIMLNNKKLEDYQCQVSHTYINLLKVIDLVFPFPCPTR